MEGLKAKAAQSLGVTPGEIAKSLLFKLKKDFIMILMAGDKRIDNRKLKISLMLRPRCLKQKRSLR